MARIDVTVDCPVFDSFRVQQVAGMFDVPLASGRRSGSAWKCPTTLGDEPWRIGLIVGPSGSGKSTIARRMFGQRLYRPREWPRGPGGDRRPGRPADQGDHRPVHGRGLQLAAELDQAVPRALSNGEQFRCDLARALASGSAVMHETPSSARTAARCFDEFTSVVDRNVARVASAAIAKGIRSGQIGGRFVAVTCHYDVTEWLQPDWVIDMATVDVSNGGVFHDRRSSLRSFVAGARAWPLFARHHYLSGALSTAARCFLALWEGSPVAFCATVSLFGQKNRRRISRIVTLPD